MAIVRPENCHQFRTAFLLNRDRWRGRMIYHDDVQSTPWWRAKDWERWDRHVARYARIHNIWWRTQPALLALVVVFGSLWLASQ